MAKQNCLVTNIIQNIVFCGTKKKTKSYKQSQGLEQHEGD